MLMPTKCRSDTLYELYSRLVRLVQGISIPPKRLLLRPLHDISYSCTRHLYSQKGGSKVEVKNSPPPLKTPLFKGYSVNLVEVEVNSLFFFFLFCFISFIFFANSLNFSCLFQHYFVSLPRCMLTPAMSCG